MFTKKRYRCGAGLTLEEKLRVPQVAEMDGWYYQSPLKPRRLHGELHMLDMQLKTQHFSCWILGLLWHDFSFPMANPSYLE